MKRKTTLASIGGYQPFLFCIGMYIVALFFSIFICSAIFYAINSHKSIAEVPVKKVEKTAMVDNSQQVLLTVTK